MAEESSSTPTPLAEIEHGPSKFDQFLEAHLKKMILALVAIVVAVAAFIVITGLKESADTSAGDALVSASEIAGYREVMESYPDSPAAGSAAIFLANEQWTDGRQEDAITTLNAFIKQSPEHPARSTANITLAYHYLEQGKVDEAKSKFHAVADDSSGQHLASFALMALGDIEKAAGNEAEARAHYESAVNIETNDLSMNQLANERLGLLGVDPPTKIAPPVPEPAPTDPSTPGAPIIPNGFGIKPPTLTPTPVIPAPETETPAPETETPAPEAETPAPETETPAPETETPAPETEAPAAESEQPAQPDGDQGTE